MDSGYAKNENLMAVAFVSENEGWFVGTHGTVLYYNNGQWSQPDSGTSETLYSVAVTKAHDGLGGGVQRDVLKVQWNLLGLPAGDHHGARVRSHSRTTSTALPCSDENTGWAVGNLGTILKYDGQTWTALFGQPLHGTVEQRFGDQRCAGMGGRRLRNHH